MRKIIDAILGMSGYQAYGFVFLIAALECSAFIGLIFPGELAVVLGGVLAFQGKVSLPVMAGVAMMGSIAGDSIGYAVGRRWGEQIFGLRLARRLVKPRHRKRAEVFLRRRGGSAVLLGRFTTALRVLVPGLAGMARMRYRTFLIYNVMGGIIWAGGFTLLGYLAGNAWGTVEKIAARAGLALGALFLVILLTLAAGRWLARHESEVRAWWARQLERPNVASLRLRFHRQISFLKERIDPRGAFGLYLTVGVITSLAVGWGAAAALQDLAAREELAVLDKPVGAFVLAHRSGAFTRLMGSLAYLTHPVTMVVTAVLFAIVGMKVLRSLRPAAYMAACVAGGFLLDAGFQVLAHRLRPADALTGVFGEQFSTGYIALAVALFGGGAFVLSRLGRWKLAVWVWVGAVLAVLLASVSRLYLTVYHMSDIVTGLALGATWLSACSTAWLIWDRMEEHPELRSIRDRAAKRVIRWAFVVVTLGVLVHVGLPAIPGIRHSATALGRMKPELIALAVIFEIGSNLALAQLYRTSLATLGSSIPFSRVLPASLSMFTVAHIMPAGGAAGAIYGAGRIASLGVPSATAATGVAMGGILGMAVLVAIVSLGALGSLLRGSLSPAYLTVTVVALLIVGGATLIARAALRSSEIRERLLRRVERAFGRLGVRPELNGLREALTRIAEVGGIRTLKTVLGWSAANWLLDVGALWIMFFGFGYRMHPGVLLVGYGVANLINILPVTPGGLGVVEAGLAGTYTAFGVPGSIAVVTVLAYRLLSYWLPVVAGVPFYLRGRGMRSMLEPSLRTEE